VQLNDLMKSIKINFRPADGDELKGQSKWWGSADLPENMDYPLIPYDDGEDDPMTFICQIRCADLAEADTENLLPHEGMLYFFADIDEFVHHMDEGCECGYYNGISEWDPELSRVIYSPTTENLQSHTIVDENNKPLGLPAQRITFEAIDNPYTYDFKLLGLPYFEEIRENYPDHINLLQLDENDDWGMLFYDCGMVNFVITPEDLKARRFNRVKFYFHCL